MSGAKSVSPSVYKIRHGLQSVNGASSQIDDVTAWWSQVFSSDRAKARYEQASGNVDDSFEPPPAEAVNHFGFRWAGLLLAGELTRQAGVADRWCDHHRTEARRLRAEAEGLQAQAASLRAQAARTEDSDESAALDAEAAALEGQAAALYEEAAKHDEWARLALAWYDAASLAAHAGEDLVAQYDSKFAELNRAVQATGGDRAERKEYAA
jgi:hypothetical protein